MRPRKLWWVKKRGQKTRNVGSVVKGRERLPCRFFHGGENAGTKGGE